MIRTPARFTIRVLFAALFFTGAVAAVGVVVPAGAGAYATIEDPPQFSPTPGLPDGRVYEQVSPADKNGNEAGANTNTAGAVGAQDHYGVAAADGNAVLFEGTGPMGESPSGESKWFVADKKTGERGWNTRSLVPAQRSALTGGIPRLDPSSDLSHAMVETATLLGGEGLCPDLFLTGSDPFIAATWLGRTELADPVQSCGTFASAPVGGTPDFSTVYFVYAGTLLPEDVSRAGGWGFYENREGVLHEVGTLPDGKLDPFGAVPAVSGYGRAIAGNQVSADGSRAFFVSPDPASCTYNGGENNCAVDPPELYVRENGERTQLLSRDTLLPESHGLPASAPGGVLRMPNPTFQNTQFTGSYVFASPDGSQAFFQSDDALTKPAEEASPGTEPKTYDFDVDTGTLTYLPGVVLGEILATDNDGSRLAFVRPEAAGAPAELDLWSAGPDGGTVTPVSQFPGPPSSGGNGSVGVGIPSRYVTDARISGEGSVLVFQTASRLSGAFNSGGDEEIYRYDVLANTLGCVSCAPAGIVPRGDASISILHAAESQYPQGGFFEQSVGSVDERGISADGDRIFFESPDPLVPQDANTSSPAVSCSGLESCAQGRDVYEWENGVVYLISSGKSALNSYFLDNSENGNDVFFATAEGLVPGDTDGGYDVYDARIPREGEPYPPKAVPCEGSVCQGPPNIPAPLTPPASATFSGLGNPAPEVTPPPAKKVTTKTVKCAKGKKLSHGKCVKVKNKKKKAKKASDDRRAK